MLLSRLLKELNYEQSPHYRSHGSEFEPETAHLFRAARAAGVSGIYVFQASPSLSQKIIVDRPAVYVAQAKDLEEARTIHRSLWNLFYAPYVIVLLPHQIRVYTGFKYSEQDQNKGFLDEFPLDDLRLLLAEFSSDAIDTGRIWQKGKYKDQLDEQERVDKRLLMNLRQLGKELKNRGLDASVAHALIGKYVYIRYLWDREILTEAWLQEQHLEKENIFSRTANADGLSRLIAALEKRFNGKIFPIDFTQANAPTDLHVRLTASVFLGDETVREDKNKIIRQLHLNFKAYNFAYIPIEILSDVYQQFIEDARKKGAIYTPEILADYLLSEVSSVKPLTAETKVLDPACGWGTFQDKRAISTIEMLFPSTLEDFRKQRNWFFSEGAQLRDNNPDTKPAPELKGKKRFQSKAMRSSLFRFSVPQNALSDIPDEMCYIRKRGGDAGLDLTEAPHIILSPFWDSYVTFSNIDFLIPPRQMAIAGPREDADVLRVLSIYLNSSLVSYYLFFHVPTWGVFLQARLVTLTEVRKVPTPNFTQSEVEELVALYNYLVYAEKQHISEVIAKVGNLQMPLFSNGDESFDDISVPDLLSKISKEQKEQVENEVKAFHEQAQSLIDEKIFELFAIPADIRLLVTDFVRVRLLLDRPAAFDQVIREPREYELLDYARELRDELDGFVGEDTHHRISITYSPDLIECIIEVVNTDKSITLDSSRIRAGDITSSRLLSGLSESLKEQVSQWIYMQRGLRLFDGPRIHLYKPSRLIDWTRTQAMNDAGDILGEVLAEV